MQALRLARALRIIDDGLRLKDIGDLIIPLLEGGQSKELLDEKPLFADLLWNAGREYQRLAEDAEIRAVMQAFALNTLFNTAELTFLLSTFEASGATYSIYQNPMSFGRFDAFAHRAYAVHLLRVGLETLVIAPRHNNVGEHEDVVELRVFQRGGESLSTMRLTQALESIEDLHDAIVDWLGISEARFGIAYLDSGSDWMIAIKSSQEVVRIMRSTLAAWQRLRSLGLDGLNQENAFISAQLVILRDIDAAVENGSLTSERGEHMKQRILKRLDAVTGYGISLEGEPSGVMEEERQLLTGRNSAGLLLPDRKVTPQDEGNP